MRVCAHVCVMCACAGFCAGVNVDNILTAGLLQVRTRSLFFSSDCIFLQFFLIFYLNQLENAVSVKDDPAANLVECVLHEGQTGVQIDGTPFSATITNAARIFSLSIILSV